MADQKMVRDERGQDQPADKSRAQRPSVSQASQNSGYASNSGSPSTGGEGLRGQDKSQGDLNEPGREPGIDTPEGLQRERKHPVNPTTGRKQTAKD